MTTENIVQILSGAGPGVPQAADDRALADLPLNDYGNGKRLIARYGLDMLWIKEAGWHLWTGKRFEHDQDKGGAALKFAHKVAEAIGREVLALEVEFIAEMIEAQPDVREDFFPSMLLWTQSELRKSAAAGPEVAMKVARINAHRGWKNMSGNLARTEAMLKAAAPYLSHDQVELDADPFVLNVQNGTLDMHNGHIRLRDHNRADMCTKIAGAPYQPKADCPGFREFIRMIMPESAVASFLQTAFGYCATADTGEQVLLILYGGGANGKSTFLNCCEAALGDYSMRVPVETFLYQDGKGGADASPDVARLPRSRLLLASELEIGARLSEKQVKTVTGGEKMTARMLHKGFFDFEPTFKLIMSCNSKPTIRGSDHGIWRRVMMIPFGVKIPKNRIVKGMHRVYIDGELPGMLNWLLEGMQNWAEVGLDPPETVLAAIEEYRTQSDPIGEFARWALAPATGELSASRIYDIYVAWCERDGFTPKSHTLLGLKLGDMGFRKERHGTIFYQDLELSPDAAAFEYSLNAPQVPEGDPID